MSLTDFHACAIMMNYTLNCWKIDQIDGENINDYELAENALTDNIVVETSEFLICVINS